MQTGGSKKCEVRNRCYMRGFFCSPTTLDDTKRGFRSGVPRLA